MSEPQGPSGPQHHPYNGAPPGQPYAAPYLAAPPRQDGSPTYGHSPGHSPGRPPRKVLPRWGVLTLGVGGGLAAMGFVPVMIYAFITMGSSSEAGSGAEPTASPPVEQSPDDFEDQVPELEVPDTEVPGAEELPEGTSEEQAELVDVTAAHGGLAGDTVDPDAVYTAVDLEVENGSSEPYSLDLLYLEVVLDDGSSALALHETRDADIDLISDEDIPPGESISGQVAVPGEVQPVQVEINPLFGDGTIVVDVE